MPVAQNLIADEAIVFTSEKHWMAPLRDSLGAILMLIAAYVVGWISPNGDGIVGAVGDLLDLVRIGLVVAAVGWIIYNVIVWRTAEFAVTNLRVVREEGFVSRRSSATLLASISDVQSSVGLLGKSLHYGDLAIYTQSGAAGSDHFKTITKPEDFRNAILTHKMDLAKAADARPTAPASVAIAPTAPALAGAPATATDAADALVRLADLRDRGAITPEDYEAKKAELLARM